MGCALASLSKRLAPGYSPPFRALARKERLVRKESSTMKVLISQCPSLYLPIIAGAFLPLPAWAGELPEPDKQPGARWFGDPGELAISGATQFRLDHTWTSFDSAEFQQMSLIASGAVDYFVLRGLSLGAGVSYSGYDQPGFPANSSLSLGPRAGYNVPLARQWSLWPDVS